MVLLHLCRRLEPNMHGWLQGPVKGGQLKLPAIASVNSCLLSTRNVCYVMIARAQVTTAKRSNEWPSLRRQNNNLFALPWLLQGNDVQGCQLGNSG